MGSLSLVKDSSGNIVGASIAGNKIDGFVGATQSLAGGELSAVLTVNFDSVSITEQEPVPAPALTATFAAGTETGTTAATITGAPSGGNHFAYVVSDTEVSRPNVGDVVVATPYTSGANITGVDDTTNKYVGLYELTNDNKVVKFLGHTLITSEIAA